MHGLVRSWALVAQCAAWNSVCCAGCVESHGRCKCAVSSKEMPLRSLRLCMKSRFQGWWEAAATVCVVGALVLLRHGLQVEAVFLFQFYGSRAFLPDFILAIGFLFGAH